MNKIILLLIAFTPSVLFAQKTRIYWDKETKETYYVLKTDEKIKHGEYLKYGGNNIVLVRGYYKMGVKDSIWESCNWKGQLSIKYDYSKKELIFFEPGENEKSRKYKVITGNRTIDTTLSRPPIFLLGEGYLLNELMRNVRYPREAAKNGKSGKVIVAFTVDKDGKATNHRVQNPVGFGLDEEALRVAKLLPDEWLPGLLNGQPVDVEVNFPIKFSLGDD